MLIAGEASGDNHGAHLVKSIKKLDNHLEFFGIGGHNLEKQGMEIIIPSSTLSVVGLTEVLSKLNVVFDAAKKVKLLLKKRNPDLLILIDYPEFNLHIAKKAKELGIPVLFYVSPQIWAWRSGRVKKIKKLVDHMAVILPFEVDFYKKHGVPATYVGNPLLDTFIEPKEIDSNEKLKIGLLPGSREGEVERLLPIMAKAAEILKKNFPNVTFQIPLASSIDKEQINEILNKQTLANNPCFEIIEQGVQSVFDNCKIVIVTSGTATLEAALALKPMVIIYTVSPISYFLGRLFIKVKNIGLANLVAGERLVPELIQKDASPENIARVITELMNNPKKLGQIQKKLKQVKKKLGSSGASDRTAKIALELLK